MGLSLFVNKRNKQVNWSVVVCQQTKTVGQCVCRCPSIDEINRSMRLSLSCNSREIQVNESVFFHQQTEQIGQWVCFYLFIDTVASVQYLCIYQKSNAGHSHKAQSKHASIVFYQKLLTGLNPSTDACINLTRRGMWARVDLQILRDSYKYTKRIMTRCCCQCCPSTHTHK